MLTPSEAIAYQRASNTSAGYCIRCAVKLHPFETHVCDNCAGELYQEPKARMHDEEAEKAVQES